MKHSLFIACLSGVLLIAFINPQMAAGSEVNNAKSKNNAQPALYDIYESYPGGWQALMGKNKTAEASILALPFVGTKKTQEADKNVKDIPAPNSACQALSRVCQENSEACVSFGLKCLANET